MNKLFTKLLEKRGIDEEFLSPRYDRLEDPFEMPDMEKAVQRVADAKIKNERILIYGDYDVDGVTASTLMEQTLILTGIDRQNISIMLPDRFIDGYGMSKRLVERAINTKINLVVTVDCGSRNFEIVKDLKNADIDTIITDHHECEAELPAAVAVVNAKRKDFEGPRTLQNLAGVGAAFKVAEALKDKELIKNGQEKWLLDLVLIGTICDSMELTGENRTLCYYGMKVLEKTKRPGLKELMQKAGVNPQNLTSESIGFQIGPRLNAAGRLESAELSLKLLRTDSASEAAMVAERLEILNKERRTAEKQATSEIKARGIGDEPVIIEEGNWHEGILGIVAGRLVETYHRPAFVLSETETGILKGSGRSFGEFNLAEALAAVKTTIRAGGGHAAAAGVKLEKTALADFKTEINQYYNSLNLTHQERFLKQTADLKVDSLKDFSLEFLDDLKKLEPYGNGNLEPIFELQHARIVDSKRMGSEQNHLRLDIAADDIMADNKRALKTVAFFAPENWFNLEREISHNFLFKIAENEWQGTRSLEGRLVDIL